MAPDDSDPSDEEPDEALSRREVLGASVGVAVAAAGGSLLSGSAAAQTRGPSTPAGSAPASADGGPTNELRRMLGRTGAYVGPVSLGGEGALRTMGREELAVPVILEALRLGVTYCDTAPAYQQSQDYYGAAFRAAGAGARDRVFLASKTHVRSRDGALRLLDDSLRRLGTDHLDLWQLHDLREQADLDEIFGRGGAIEAVERALADGRIRFVGITGHHDPAILLEAMRRYSFHSVLVAFNPADSRRMPFLSTVVPRARQLGMAVVGMKVLAAGRLVADRAARVEELIRYGATHADTVVIGCSSVSEVRQNLEIGARLRPMSPEELDALERRIAPRASRYDSYKAP
ncbi:MAG: aldo/keto reductase [Deltaproteobacteria bacterium]|nr:aldo/keto reductase [Deltaproteobacteria bacterium]